MLSKNEYEHYVEFDFDSLFAGIFNYISTQKNLTKGRLGGYFVLKVDQV